ncbi:MAG: P-loop NTPase, partial [Bdellovibrionota bacterium]|nr:P-loop NTPase [Bdellovibrionota bacterium]
HDIFGNGGVKTEVEKLETNLLGQVPLDIKLRKGSDEGKPYMAFNFDEGDEVSKSYMAIAKNVDKILFESKKDKKGFFGKFFGK